MSARHVEHGGGAHSPSLRHWVLFATLVMFYGTSFLFIKVGVETIPPLTLVALRLSLAALSLTAAVFLYGRRFPPLREGPGLRIGIHWRAFTMLALTGNAVPFTLISWGSKAVPSSLAGILMAIMPLSTMVLAALFVHGEHITLRRLLGFLMGFAGICVLFGAEALGLAATQPLDAQLAILLGAVFYAVAAVLTKKLPPCDPIAAAAGIHICAALMIVPLAFVFEAPLAASPSAGSLGSAVALALGSSAFCQILLLHLIRDVGPTFTSQLNYLVPLWAVVMGFLFLGEMPRWNALGALVLILAGISVAQSRARRLGSTVRQS